MSATARETCIKFDTVLVHFLLNLFAAHNKTQLRACLLLERNMLIMCTVLNMLPVNIGVLTCCSCVNQAYPSLISRDNQIHSLILWFENGRYFFNSVWFCRYYIAALSVIFANLTLSGVSPLAKLLMMARDCWKREPPIPASAIS